MVVPGLWLANPHKTSGAKTRKHRKSKVRHKAKSKVRHRRRKNFSTLTLVRNPKKGGKMRVKRRKRAKAHKRSYTKRRRSYSRKRRYTNRKRSYRRKRHTPVAHKRRYRRRRRSNPAKAVVRYRRRSVRHRRGRRRNPSTVSRAYSTGKSLFSMKTAKQVIAGAIGWGGTNVLANFVPWSPAGTLGLVFKKGIAGVATYMLAGMVSAARPYKKYILYGAALNIGFDMIGFYAPGLSAKAKLSGYSGYGEFTSPTPEVMRMIPTAAIPTGA